MESGHGSAPALADLATSLLRLPGNETQLTRAMRELMRAQDALARQVVGELLDRVPSGPRAPSGTLIVEGEKPATVERFLRSDRKVGRLDWVFTAPEDDFELVVEVKIGMAATAKQVVTYTRTLKQRTGGIVLLTRDPSRLRLDHPRFLGVVRWHELLPALLEHEAPPSAEGILWHALLRRAAQAGDLGTPAASWEALRAADTRTRDRLLSAVARATMDELVAELSQHPGFRGADLRRGRTRSRWATLEMNDGPDPVFSFELRFDGALAVEAWAWPPAPQRTRRARWSADLRAALDAGWRLDGARLYFPRRPVPDASGVLVRDLLATVRSAFAPLGAPSLLPRYRGLVGPVPATEAELRAGAAG